MLSDPFDANYAIFQNDDTNLFPLRVGTSGASGKPWKGWRRWFRPVFLFIGKEYRFGFSVKDLFMGLLMGFLMDTQWNFRACERGVKVETFYNDFKDR